MAFEPCTLNLAPVIPPLLAVDAVSKRFGGLAALDTVSLEVRAGDEAGMKFFVDTADTDDIRSLAASGLLDGVTTNPSLIAKSGKRILDVIAEICAIVPGPVSAEVAATDYDGMMREAAVLRKIAKNVAVKVPLTPDGLKTCKALSSEGTMVNVTLCFSAAQALLAAKAGASFISPFVGRLDDNGHDGMLLIEETMQIYRQYPHFKTEVLVENGGTVVIGGIYTQDITNTLVGEFRVHYAGFFDPGFGHAGAGGAGSRAVLEVRSRDVPFILEDGQIVGRLVYERMADRPASLYGVAQGSNYQGQGLKLSKHFQPVGA